MAGAYGGAKMSRHNDGGVNESAGPAQLARNQWRFAQNVDMNSQGSPRLRNGHELMATIVPAKRELRSWWRMEELVGERRDISDGYNHLVPTGAVGRVAGKDGFAADFDGTTFLSIANALQFDLSRGAGNFSIAFWYKAAAHAATRSIVSRHDGLGTAGYEVEDVGGLIRFRVYRPGPITIGVIAVTAIDDGNWHSVVVAHNAAAERSTIFLDGVSDATFTDAARPDYADFAATFFVGATQAGAASFIGQIDDLSFWTIELVGANAVTLHNGGLGGGTAIFGDNGLSKAGRGLFQLKPTATPAEVIGVAAGRFLRFDALTGRMTPVRFPSNFGGGYLSVDALNSFAQLNNRAYSGNGINPNLRYEGLGALFTQGLDDTAAIVAGLNIIVGGAIENDGSFYQYRLVPLRKVGGGRTIIGRPSTAASGTIQIPVASPNRTINIPTWPAPPADAGQTDWGLYRIKKVAAGDPDPLSSYFVIADLPVSTTTYNDTTSQADATATGDNLGLYIEHRKAPPCAFRRATTVNAGDVLLMAGDSAAPENLYPSSPRFPDVHLANLLTPIGRDDGDPITGIAPPVFDLLLVTKEDSIFSFVPTYDGSDFPYKFRQVVRTFGCLSHFSLVARANWLRGLSAEGVFELYGVDDYGDLRIRIISQEVEKTVQSMNVQRRPFAYAVHTKDPRKSQYRIAIATGGATKNTKILPLDDSVSASGRRRRAWLGTWVGVTAEVMANVEDPATLRDSIWIFDDTGRVLRADSGTNDVGATIIGVLTTRADDGDAGAMIKRTRELIVEGETVGGSLLVQTSCDYGRGAKGPPIPVRITTPAGIVGGADYGFADWGTGILGGGVAEQELAAVRVRLSQATGHAIEATFSSATLDMTWVLNGWGWAGILLPTHRMRKAV